MPSIGAGPGGVIEPAGGPSVPLGILSVRLGWGRTVDPWWSR
ncbi:hypothetical protein [Nonomuraea gerenzanensis]|uniref:Uncharacterized protein n=1 Tax=Nonomuraea gerenzanensis TaxID=93944 RepID=A0A1M4EGG2_9ACTN|nr:hypothetical protein [Nonomuraea gerenzanensis]SBO97748.1 hypothetical protein BN4615_P7264 [Nonomuraea gerenzanensis]